MKSGTSRHSAQHDQRGQVPPLADSKVDRGPDRGTESEVRPDLVDATRYDLDRLERAIRSLVAQQQALKRENDELRIAVSARSEEVARLTSELEAAEERRRTTIGKVDALIEELDKLDSALDRSMSDSEGRVVDPALEASTSSDVSG